MEQKFEQMSEEFEECNIENESLESPIRNQLNDTHIFVNILILNKGKRNNDDFNIELKNISNLCNNSTNQCQYKYLSTIDNLGASKNCSRSFHPNFYSSIDNKDEVDQVYSKLLKPRRKSTGKDSMPYSKIKIHLKELSLIDSTKLISKIEENK